MSAVIIGIDGGGTKTRVTIVETGGRVMKTLEGGSINYNNIGVEKAFANFKYIMDQLNPDYNLIQAISIGDPAQDDICINPYTEIFLHKIRKNLPINPRTKIFTRSDVYMALYGLTQGQPGVLMISGTGSMGAAIDDGGNYYVSGGWGFPVSDTGSGYDIAVDAFKYIFAAYDKYGYNNIKKPGGMLAVSVLDYYGVSHPRELINCFHGEHNSRARVAEFSKVVYYCAEKGCVKAVRILENAGKKLALCTGNLIDKIKYPPGRPPFVGIYGSVFLHNHFVRESFEQAILRKYPSAEIVKAKTAPEYAAAIYARHALEENIQEEQRALYR
ncbi:MAG: BadF/BadG/BcrA/BcrD ATPase family protein [Clostridia bacterium]